MKKFGSQIKAVLSDTVGVWGIKIEEFNVGHTELVTKSTNRVNPIPLLKLGAQLRDRITLKTSKFGVVIQIVEFELD